MQLERTIAKTEYKLSKCAAVPVLGSIPAAGKAVLAAGQITIGSLAMISALPFCVTKEGRALSSRAFSHVVNGMANLGASAIEGVPLVGTAIFAYRFFRIAGKSDYMGRDITGQEHSVFVGYRIIEENPEEIAATPPGVPHMRTSPCISV